MPEKRICLHCHQEFEPATNEMKHRRYCSKVCVRKAGYWRNHAAELERMRAWRAAHPDLYRKIKQNYYHSNKGKVNLKHKDWELRRTHGITLAEYDAECARRQDKCDICSTVCPNRTLRIDHDHSSRARRGFICDSCNLGIGKLKDSSKVLQAAADYLRRFGC